MPQNAVIDAVEVRGEFPGAKQLQGARASLLAHLQHALRSARKRFEKFEGVHDFAMRNEKAIVSVADQFRCGAPRHMKMTGRPARD